MSPWNKVSVGVSSPPLSSPSFFTKVRSFYRTLQFHIPLTLQGTCTLGLALYLLIHGLGNRNAYEILLGVTFTLLLGVLLVIGYFIRRACHALIPTWQIPDHASAADLAGAHPTVPSHSATAEPIDSTGLTQTHHHRIGGIPKAPPFFRVHFEIQGTLTVGNGGVVFYSVDWASRRGQERGRGAQEEITGTLPFPLGGVFQGVGCRTLRDIFGLVRYHLPPVLHRSFPVLPAPSRKQIQLRLDPSLGLEEKRTLRSTDEERYFMREYAPGDRFRDINWKTSSRLSFLVTRIAPQAQEKTRLLPVAFRCFGPPKPDLSSLWALDRCKAWLVQFLWTVRKEHPEFILRVTTPLLEEELATDQETESFCEEIAGYSFHSLQEEGRFTSLLSTPEEVFVFSTAYDDGLSRFLGGRFDLPTHLYLTLPSRQLLGGGRSRKGIASSSTPELSRFNVKGCLREGGLPFPYLFVPVPLPSTSPPRPLRGILEIEPTEVSL